MSVKIWCCVLVLPLLFMFALPGVYHATANTNPISQKATGNRLLDSAGAASMVTQRNDTNRSGANLNESILNTSTVSSTGFGKLFSRAVDGFIYAQPLYLPSVVVPQSGVHNVVYVATEHDSVYAFDADDPAASTPLWQVSLGQSVPSTDISPTYRDLTPEIGITSTPVIDPNTGTLYLVAKTKDVFGYHQSLHALDVTSGAEKFGGPTEIAAVAEGIGDGGIDGSISFDPFLELNRPALLLQNGTVYMAFGSHGDTDPYHGWVLGYNAQSLQQVAVYNTTPDGGRGAIWMAGQGLVGDSAGNIYVTTGNGTCDANADCGRNLGESFIKLSSGLVVEDWFTPNDRGTLDVEDKDLGSGGPLLIPGTTLLAAAGKDGTFRLVDSNNMGRFNPDQNLDVEEFQVTRAFFGAPVFWNSATQGPTIYMWGGGDTLKAFQLANGQIQQAPISQSTVMTTNGLANSAPLSLSANGNTPGTGIVWAACPDLKDANLGTVHGILRAFDASNLSVELWNSTQNQARDDLGNFAKFCPPTIANGKVYVSTFSGQLNVYGVVAASCNVSVSKTNLAFSPSGGASSIDVNAVSDCPWNTESQAGFINVIVNDNTGDGSVTISVAPNTGPARTGVVLIGGQPVVVFQESGCSYSISSNYVKFNQFGGTSSVQVTSSDGCPWTALSNSDWITVNSGATGTGTGPVVYSVVTNPTTAKRKGSITVAGTVIQIVQKPKN